MNDSENNVSYNTLCTLGIEYKPSGNLVRIIVNGTLGDSLEIITAVKSHMLFLQKKQKLNVSEQKNK